VAADQNGVKQTMNREMLATRCDAPLAAARGLGGRTHPDFGTYQLIAVNRVATGVATQAASSVTWRHPADWERGRRKRKRTLAAQAEPTATTVRDREAPGSNPGPPTTFVFRSRRFQASSTGAGAQIRGELSFSARAVVIVVGRSEFAC
jgi:hypothetical protein